MEYMKPFLSLEQQADLLIEDRGMIANRDDLVEHLKDVGYYRLSGYWHIHKKNGSDKFWEGTSFQRVWDAYVFDRQFRLVVLDAVERIEVYMRNQLAYLLAEATGPFGFLDPSGLPRLSNENYDRFISKCHDVYKKAKKAEPFAKHFEEKYGDVHELPPYWMLVNLMDFGMVVTLYRGADAKIRGVVADSLGVPARVLDSWLVSINTVRNICAHHGRLWNRVIGNPPKIPNAEKWHDPYEVKNDRVFGILTVMSYLLEQVAPKTSWRKKVLNMVLGLSQANQERMGFSGEWRECPFWRPYLSELK